MNVTRGVLLTVADMEGVSVAVGAFVGVRVLVGVIVLVGVEVAANSGGALPCPQMVTSEIVADPPLVPDVPSQENKNIPITLIPAGDAI